MKRSSGVPALTLLLLLVSASARSCGPGQPAQDSSDQARLREIFGIPRDAELLSYDGYPPTVGFGQREGLSISAVYLLSDAGEARFARSAEGCGWRPLPVPPDVVEAIPFEGLDVPLGLSEGFYICRTAGDNVLYASATVPVEEASSVSDIIAGVLDASTNRLYVQVRAAY